MKFNLVLSVALTDSVDEVINLCEWPVLGNWGSKTTGKKDNTE